mgnify:CR=1 FL=1
MVGVTGERSDLPETGVVTCTGGARRIHRLDETADEPAPACKEAFRCDSEFREVSLPSLLPFASYSLCVQEGCFPSAESNKTTTTGGLSPHDGGGRA